MGFLLISMKRWSFMSVAHSLCGASRASSPGDCEAISSLKLGDNVSFCFALFAENSDVELARSKWSDWTEIKNVGEIPQMNIGDGFAQIETIRKIRVKTVPTNDSDGKLVATIKGHGVLTFPMVKEIAEV
ncbi:hypothetical protein CC86DRAFT_457320 [Ophiobolus disseminans]|uniref:Uncharacterized protein n=1 Tax=Ophiobolus disseminans TaxID=1469910 RepID=A0A6A6ZS41_9PLEO|nr:hypothetical protein CC86DRAFT_457320 [Ophiobolus disseminans]